MAKRYYSESEDIPVIVKSIIETVLIYIAQTLYADEYSNDPHDTLYKRFIKSTMTAGESVNIKDAVEQLKQSQNLMPFTAYQPGPFDMRDEPSVYPITAGAVYVSEFNGYAASYPMELDLNMVSFFNTPFDYNRAKKLIHWADSNLTRLFTPIIVQNKEYFLPIDLGFEMDRGNLAYDYEQQLESDKIFNFIHNAKIQYFDLIVDSVNISPVDDVIFSLKRFSDDETIDSITHSN